MNYTNNNAKLNLRTLGLIPFLFVFIPAFAIPFGKKPILVLFIAVTFFFILYLTLFPLKLKKHIYRLYKYTPLKYYVYFAYWIIFSGFILVIFGKYSLGHYIYYLILFLLINMSLPLLLPTVIINNKKTLHYAIKFISVAIFILLLLGILSVIGTFFSIEFINTFFNAIVNFRVILDGISKGAVQMYDGKAFSLFAEPGWFGGFISFVLPIIYFVSKSKYKLFKKPIINLMLKKGLVPLALICTLLTRSPIWAIFNFGIYIFLVAQNSKETIKKHKIAFLAGVITLVFLTSFMVVKINRSIDSEAGNGVKYLSRIAYVIEAVKKRDYLIVAENEDSLASRITSYINSLRIFLDYPITGVGLGNSKFYMAKKFDTSPVPLTIENQNALLMASKSKGTHFNEALLYQILSETGILGLFLYYYFLFILYKRLKYIVPIYKNSIVSDFIFGLRKSILLLFFVYSIYDIGLTTVHIWIFLGIGISVIYLGRPFIYESCAKGQI